MLGKIKAALTGPFALAFAMVMLLSGGIAAGIFSQTKAHEAKLRAIAEERRAAAAAAAGPPRPQLQVAPASGPSPVAQRYIPFGGEFVSNFGRSARFVLLEITVVTRYGPQAEELLTNHKAALRAEILAALSELTFAAASKPDGQEMVARRILEVVNAAIFEREKIKLVEEILITRFVVK